MRFISRLTLIATILTTWSCTPAVLAPEVVEVPLTMLGDYAVVPVSVAGSAPLLFILDTAAGGSVISPSTRAALAIDASQSRFDTIVGGGGESRMESVPLTGLTVGSLTVEDLRAVVIDLSKFQRSPSTSYAGILGQDFLQRFDVEIDLPAQRLRLYRNTPARYGFDAGAAVRNQSDTAGWLTFEATLDGQPVRAIVDSGSPRTIVNWHAARAIGVTETSPRARKRDRGTGGLGAARADTFDLDAERVTLAGTDFRATPVRIADLPVFGLIGMGDRPAMLAGLDLLRRCAIFIDYDQRIARLCRTPANLPTP